MTQQSVTGTTGSEPELYRAKLLCASPIHVYHNRWRETGEDFQDNFFNSDYIVNSSTDQANPNSISEDLVYGNDPHSVMIINSTVPRPLVSPDPAAQQWPYPVISVSRPTLSSPMTEICSPICSICCPTDPDWVTVRATSESPGPCDQDHVSVAAHLHLLGESLFLIGHHLQETDKKVSTSSSLSLLLDSLLCALAPVFCLTAQIPELKDCTRHNLASTLENIAYVMPGL